MGLVLGDVLATVGGGSVTTIPVDHTHASTDSGSVETVVVLDLPVRCRVIMAITDPVASYSGSTSSPQILGNGALLSTWGENPGIAVTVATGSLTLATKRRSATIASSPSFRGTIYYWPEKE